MYDALQRLREGNARFVQGELHPDVLADSNPFAAVVGCVDARVPPEIVFDQGIGDVFTARVAGNVVSDDILGSLELAASFGIQLIVVMGHTDCAAIRAVSEDLGLAYLTPLLEWLRPAVERAGGDTTAAAWENVRNGVARVRAAMTVPVVGAVYDVETGVVTFQE